MFPGQGSQAPGMLSDMAEASVAVRELFSRASASLNYDLWDVVQHNPEDKLNHTEVTQPALLCACIAIWHEWINAGGTVPSMLAGHSLGEYTALVCAEVISFDDAVSLVAERGRLMQEAVQPGQGAMAAVLGLDEEQVQQVCNEAKNEGIVSAANFNSPGQIVLAGETKAVERAAELAKEAGAKRAILLPVSVPSHCALMKPAAGRFAEKLEEVNFSNARIPVIQNVDVESRTDAMMIKKALLRQLYEPVQWIASVEKLVGGGVNTIIECGPGKVLAGLIKRIDRSITVYPVFDPETLDKAIKDE